MGHHEATLLVDAYNSGRNPLGSELQVLFGKRRADLIAEALAESCDELREHLGDDPSAWRWGDLHPLRLEHPVASGRSLLDKWNLPELPYRGSGATVAAANFALTEGETPVAGMQSLRFVIDMADPAGAMLSHPGGQSGHPRHPDTQSHFDAFVEDAPVPLRWDDDDIASVAVSSQQIVPEGQGE